MRYMKKIFLSLVLCLTVAFVYSQVTSQPVPKKIVVLVPFDLDSAYTDFTYNLGTINIPQYFMPGLDFYNGVKMALDSLQKMNVQLEAWIFDTRSKTKSASQVIKEITVISPNLILAAFTNITEQKTYAEFALKKNIPLVSVTYPNDAYIHKNPFFIIENSTLQTHMDSLYAYTARTFSQAKIIYLTRNGFIENKIKKQVTDLNKKTKALTYSLAEINTNPTTQDLQNLMDSTRENVIFCGVLDEAYGLSLVKALSAATSYRTVAIGMPTWDGIKALRFANCKNVRIIYTSPFYYAAGIPFVDQLKDAYKQKFYSRPGDMVYKGFESAFYFIRLLEKYQDDFINHLNDPQFNVHTPFNFSAVKLNPTEALPDYIENKHLYFINLLNGAITGVF